MSNETMTNQIPVEILSLVATAQQRTAQVWIDGGDLEFRIWLEDGEHRGVIGGSVWSKYKYTSVYAISDDGITNVYCYFGRDGISVTRNPSDRYEPRREEDE